MKMLRETGLKTKRGAPLCEFICPTCGLVFVRDKYSGKRTNQCKGCYTKEFIRGNTTHGESRTRLYSIHQDMIGRCHKKRFKNYKYYGGRGIKVCDDWHNYKNFSDWARSNGYDSKLTIDRIDEEKDYCPDNCQWITREENSSSTRNTRFSYDDAEKIRKEYACGGISMRELGEKYKTTCSNISNIVNRVRHAKRHSKNSCG